MGLGFGDPAAGIYGTLDETGPGYVNIPQNPQLSKIYTPSVVNTFAPPAAALPSRSFSLPYNPFLPNMSLNLTPTRFVGSPFPTTIPAPGIAKTPGGGTLGTIGTVVGGVATAADILKQIYERIRGGAGTPPAAPLPNGGTGPGSPPYIDQSRLGTLGGLGGIIGRVGGAIGRSKWVRNVVGGVVTYLLIDAAGNILRMSNRPPHRRINVLNPKALTRANRRMCGFRDYATMALRHYGYQVSRHQKPKGKKGKKRCR